MRKDLTPKPRSEVASLESTSFPPRTLQPGFPPARCLTCPGPLLLMISRKGDSLCILAPWETAISSTPITPQSAELGVESWKPTPLSDAGVELALHVDKELIPAFPPLKK